MDHDGDWSHWSDDQSELDHAHTEDVAYDTGADHHEYDAYESTDDGHTDFTDADSVYHHDASAFDTDSAHGEDFSGGQDSSGGEDHDGSADHPEPDAGIDHEPDSQPTDGRDAFGVDPDPAADHDPGWHDDEFPAPLNLGADAPVPHDGYPWSDPGLLGQPGTGTYTDPADVPDAAHDPSDLFAYAGLDSGSADGGDLWARLIGSDDPATSALARWWGPAAA